MTGSEFTTSRAEQGAHVCASCWLPLHTPWAQPQLLAGGGAALAQKCSYGQGSSLGKVPSTVAAWPCPADRLAAQAPGANP